MTKIGYNTQVFAWLQASAAM